MKNGPRFLLLLIIVSILGKAYGQNLHDARVGLVPKYKLEKSRTQKHSIANRTNLNKQNVSDLAYGYSIPQESTFSVPLSSGTPFSLLQPFPFGGVLSSMCKGGDGNFYVTDLDMPALYQFYPATGALTYLGDIIISPSETITGLSYNPNDGNYYICSTRALYKFNLVDRTVTHIGSFNIPDIKMVNLCFDAKGNCYAYDVALDQAYTINIYSGEATVLGPLGYDAEFAQGMTYDFETSTIYLSAYNKTTETAQLRIMDPLNGSTRLIADWGLDQVAAFASASPFYPVDIASNPAPANGETGVEINLEKLTWENGSGTTDIELYFGQGEYLPQVYYGSAITSFTLPPLEYSNTYRWKVVCKNDTTITHTAEWSFTAKKNPYFEVVLDEHFNDLNCWTPAGPVGLTNWTLNNTSNAGGASPEVRISWNPEFNGLSKLVSCPITSSKIHVNKLKLKHRGWWSSDPAPHIGVAITYDGGTTLNKLWEIQPTGNTAPDSIEVTFVPTSDEYQVVLFCDGNSFNISYWYIDNIYIQFDLTTGVDQSSNNIQPGQFVLDQNYPNPFNPSTTIKYSIGSQQFVSLKVYDLLGTEVATLVNEQLPAGNYEVQFPGTGRNLHLVSGVYFYQLKINDFISTKKCILIK